MSEKQKSSRRCLLDESRPCTGCGECTRCDLDPDKLCDNCMRCVKGDAEYRAITIDEIIEDGDSPEESNE